MSKYINQSNIVGIVFLTLFLLCQIGISTIDNKLSEYEASVKIEAFNPEPEIKLIQTYYNILYTIIALEVLLVIMFFLYVVFL